MKKGNTLNFAIDNKDYKLIHHLLELGEDVNYVDEYGKTPLLYAYLMKDRELVKLLLRYKPNIDIEDNNGFSVRDYIKFGRYGDCYDEVIFDLISQVE